MIRYFGASFIIAAIGLGLAGLVGGFQAAFTALVLSILEISLSFDNAVVNAAVLKDMTPVWRQRFMTWGMLIAVFGMRVVFPIVIVSVVGKLNPWNALVVAFSQPEEYARILTSAHVAVAGFGGMFLLMVFLKFFIDAKKDVHWVHVIEAPLSKLGKLETIEIVVALLALYGVSQALPEHEAMTLMIAGMFGLMTYIIVDGIGALSEHAGELGKSAAKSGLAAFLYLEVLDASFSFDGVIGAFALTNNIIIIAIGLGIGAMFVRSLTILFVERGTLDALRYLEHGAFWAIGVLAAIMFANTVTEIPEWITGTLGAALIGLAALNSLHRRSAKT